MARIPSFSLERHGLGGGAVEKKGENDIEKRK